MTFAREAWPFVAPCLLAGLILAGTGHSRWAAAAWLVGACVLLFFRNPRRLFTGAEDVVLAAADGLVTAVDQVEDPALGPGPRQRVVTFLSVFNVHVQRAPVAGEVMLSQRTPGGKVAAFRKDADRVNESHLVVIRRADGQLVGVRQIAGLVARRVVSYPRVGDRLERGQLIGLIKFGSRVDLLLPPGDTVLVARGDRPRTGSTPVGRAVAPASAGTAAGAEGERSGAPPR